MILASSPKRKESGPRDFDRFDVPLQLRTDELRKDFVGLRSDERAVGDRSLAQHLGRDAARADAIDVDVVWGEHGGQDPGHADQGRLAGAVGEDSMCPFSPASDATLTMAPCDPEPIIDFATRREAS